MLPMKIQPLYDALVGASVIDPDKRSVKPMAVADAFEALSKVEAPTDAQKVLLHECCLMLVTHDFRGLRASAQTKSQQLYSQNPDFDWRPSAAENNDTV